MMREINALGLSCPAPVLQTKQTIEKELLNAILVKVDNEAARQNVTRFLESQHFKVSCEQKGAEFHVMGSLGEDAAVPAQNPAISPDADIKKNMVMVATDKVGVGDDVLGAKLMASFLKTLKEMGTELWRLVFLNSGVKLTIEGADTLPSLKDLEDAGVTILVCGTCLDHFNMLAKKQVGETTNMLDIVTAMQVADKVINI